MIETDALTRGVCVATDTAIRAGLIPADRADEPVAKARERTRSSPQARRQWRALGAGR
jgi:F0F1-type ATP synthase epsilon subunit